MSWPSRWSRSSGVALSLLLVCLRQFYDDHLPVAHTSRTRKVVGSRDRGRAGDTHSVIAADNGKAARQPLLPFNEVHL